MAYRIAPLAYRRPLVTLKVHFAVWNFSVSHISGRTSCIIYDIFTHEWNSARGL